jgi:uncharacterized BrkB/YihY/UPF0761 family membrane protein
VRQKSKIQRLLEGVVRVLLVTAIFTLLGFAVGLFCGIVGSILFGLIRGVHPDMTLAYKFVALPLAITSLIATFFAMLWMETRRSRHPLHFSRQSTMSRTS